MSTIKFVKIRDVKAPSRGTPQSAGVDFFVPNDWNNCELKLLAPGEQVLIPSGIKVNVPTGHALIAFNKSGVASKTGLVVGACVVDEDYQGEIHLNMINTSNGHRAVEPGAKIVQFILVPVNYAETVEVETIGELYETTTERGEGGFGSTGTV
jgi:dUTP pyrophosphatase